MYERFPLIPETNTDGWIYGSITEFIDPDGCKEGDGFVQAPDGKRAGLDWIHGNGQMEVLSGPYDGTWGLFQVYFPKKVYTLEDMVENFRRVLPEVKRQYESYF
jgi:hypothetical protein